MSGRNGSGALGILLLENAPLRLPRAMGSPETFACPTLYRTVPGAWVDNVVHGDEKVLEAYIDAARALERAGAAAITTNCGFTVLYQAGVSASVSVPVATSSLLLLPLMARLAPPGRAIGVLTYDGRRLRPRHFEAAGLGGQDVPIVTAGIEGTESWAELAKPEPRVTVEALARDVSSAVHKLLGAHPEVAALLLECAAFCPLTPRIRAEVRRPVLDFITLADVLVGSVAAGRPAG
ncbi:MAG: aspartate/glutamate racemase family protein [Candidatus Rokuibacteriota bacterium]